MNEQKGEKPVAIVEKKSAAQEALDSFISQNNANQINLNNELDNEVLFEIIRVADKSDERKHELKKEQLNKEESITKERIKASIVSQKSERYYVFTALGITIMITLLIFFLKPEIIEKWITHIIALASGVLGGYGLSNKKKSLSNKITDQQNSK